MALKVDLLPPRKDGPIEEYFAEKYKKKKQREIIEKKAEVQAQTKIIHSEKGNKIDTTA